MDYGRVIDIVKQAKNLVFAENLKKNVYMKGDADFVTAVDTSISNFIKSELYKFDKTIGFFSEEESGSLTDPCWILDPIDGTTNLIYGYNMSSISLGLYKDGQIEFGVVYNPFNNECFTAKRGQGAYLDGKQLFVSQRPISMSIIEFGAGSTHKENADANFELAKEIFKNCVDVRRICSSALDLCFIAAGRIDGYFEKVLKPWDIAAGSLILTEAGGKITDYHNESLQFSKSTSVVASNSIIHDYLIETISKYTSK